MNFWQDYGALVEAAALVFTVSGTICGLAFRWVRRDRKEFVYEIYETPIINEGMPVTAIEMRNRHTGKEITSLTKLTIKFMNMSNKVIQPSDFDTPLQFDFGPWTNVFEPEGPSRWNISDNNHSATLVPIVFNEKERKEMSLFVTNYLRMYRREGHIIGVTIKERRAFNRPRAARVLDSVYLCAMVVIAPLNLIVLFFPHTWFETIIVIAALSLGWFGSMFFIAGAISRLRDSFNSPQAYRLD